MATQANGEPFTIFAENVAGLESSEAAFVKIDGDTCNQAARYNYCQSVYSKLFAIAVGVSRYEKEKKWIQRRNSPNRLKSGALTASSWGQQESATR